MSKPDLEYMKNFGEIKFAEENSMSASDFESSLKKHFKEKKNLPRGRYKFAELNSESVDDFEESFRNYFE